ncbi:MAG: hypothetical protein WC471_00460 [Candidatus Woesearchaeota archaeon]
MALSTKELLEKHKFEQEKSNAAHLDEPDINFPKPDKRFRIVLESFGMNVEEPYFWMLNMFREGLQFNDIKKLKDIFTATETSSLFGLTGTRLEREQTLAMQYMAQIGRFVKELFGMINELKKLDYRLEMYTESNKKFRDKDDPKIDRPESQAAEVALKSMWIELVEGGAKNPSSVIGLAREVGFATLPDLFFTSDAKSTDDIDKNVDKLLFNDKVKSVLKSKLFAYFSWKETTFKEWKNRRSFLIKYLRQHYEIIKTYMNWVRPYLLHAKRLGMNKGRLESADLVGAFEQSLIEIEFLAKKKGKAYTKCIVASFLYKTRPALEFQRESFQHKGPIHVGRAEITLRAYTWTPDQVKAFETMRNEEDLELLGSIDSSIDAAMNMFREDIKKYLKEAGEKFIEDDKAKMPEKKVERPPFDLMEPFRELAKAAAEPFKMIGGGFKEMVGMEASTSVPNAKKPAQLTAEKEEFDKSRKDNAKSIFIAYNLFKKSHLMPGF